MEAQESWSGQPIPPSPVDLSNPEIEPGSPALQVDSLPAELLAKPLNMQMSECIQSMEFYTVHGILQARILEWAAYLFSSVSS